MPHDTCYQHVVHNPPKQCCVDIIDRMVGAVEREARRGGLLQMLAREIDMGGFDVARFNRRPGKSKALALARSFHTPTAHECWSACLAQPGCGFWVWCSHRQGCDDGGAFDGRFPQRGCELMSLPQV